MHRCSMRSRQPFLACLAAVIAFTTIATAAAQGPTGGDATAARLGEALRPILDRPEFRHAAWGIAFDSLDDVRPVLTRNPHQLFSAASTTRPLAVGSALMLRGSDWLPSLLAKGLGGYLTTPSGRRYALSVYVNNVTVPREPDAITRIAGQALGGVVSVAYSTLP